ncbi:pyridoxamine 5'-phosphate oxidase family protein [Mucilaginibacter sabulilitoris]|uniref:Pyridoxamine 5'-phosphate oxidase family protein n=1 Tax=Mucilaginibacter sabulilitoris TaxID=1173583 RepID=A0ABZ0TQY3_9SPHI|nr:pyridoxamine 5'-phosphate oxidase family protein [Mucilaginibacter sabulilitoris]WPU95322.1 pyridoxamine 5'-phosphate oxidase family protein [Mucilaginibacter sabulilitoris]
MGLNKQFIYNFIKKHSLAVLTTVNKDAAPEAALIGIAVTPNLEIVFDTANISRKYRNMLYNPAVALVIGWDNEITLQYEGMATELNGADDLYKNLYFDTFKDARLRAETLHGIVYFKISPHWVRYCNYNNPTMIKELTF